MFEKILVPVDGSPESQTALEPAQYLAKLNGSSLVLVRVLGLPAEPDVSPLAPVSVEAYARERKRCEKYLTRLATELFQAGLTVTWEVVDCSEQPAASLAWAIEQYKIDLVIMTSHSRQGVGRVLRGSVAEQLVRQAGCPVLVVGKKSRFFQQVKHRPSAL